MSTPQQDFGIRLMQERERHGITLRTIADSTKIRETWLAALERGDISQWPQSGIFRRAYVRDYAIAIGLAPEPAVSEFVRLFPEDADAFDLPLDSSDHAETASRATAPAEDRAIVPLVLYRARALCFDAGAVLLLAGVGAALSGVALWAVIGAIGLGYFALGTLLCGQSVGGWLLALSDARRHRTQAAIHHVAARDLSMLAERSAERKHQSADISELDDLADIDGSAARPARHVSA